MGKRSNYKRNPRDLYITPEYALLPLIGHLPKKGVLFAEPCAADGGLTNLLIKYGNRCAWQSDIAPLHKDVFQFDALQLLALDLLADVIITNPPWEKRKCNGEIFNKLLRHWLQTFNGDIWLLFDADWIHTVQALEFKQYCKSIVSIGRVKWIPGTNSMGKDNCAWYCFNANNKRPVQFFWREKNIAKNVSLSHNE